jgi:ubiquitin C-terminal hydrolase
MRFQRQEESWFLLDDAKCVPVRREDALKVEAYIAFYRRSATS